MSPSHPAAPASVHRHRSSSLLPPRSTLTPARKHRKMLKDGSSEVWPESVEKIFVEGLREYWASPWATFSRGRSRWRNQYLVDHLRKAGIERTKKQVASHIQVLRNMWKGEPEFQLVAGAEDGAPESESPEAPRDSTSPPSNGDEDREFLFPASPSTPGSASSDTMFDDYIAQRPTHSPSSLRHVAAPANPGAGYLTMAPVKTEEISDFSAALSVARGAGHGRSPQHTPPAASSYAFSVPRSVSTVSPEAVGLGIVIPMPPVMFPGPPTSGSDSPGVKVEPVAPVGRPSLRINPPGIDTSFDFNPAVSPRNRVSALSLWAEFMSPLNIDVDKIAYPTSQELSHIAFRIRLCMPTCEDTTYPSALRGFQGAVSFAGPWSASATCETTVVSGGVAIYKEEDDLAQVPSPTDESGVHLGVGAYLPESWLSRSRWLNSTAPTTICQRICADGHTLAYIIYDLDRSGGSGSAPAAHLLGFKRLYRRHEAKTPSPLSATSNYFLHSDTPSSGFTMLAAPQPSAATSCAFVTAAAPAAALGPYAPHVSAPTPFGQ